MPEGQYCGTCDLALDLIIHNESFPNERDRLQTPRYCLHFESCFIIRLFENSK